jgi:signal peptidase I
VLFLVAFAALVMRACVIEPVRITDDSMAPLFSDGDVVFVSKLHYGVRVPGAGAMLWEWSKPKKGDLVVVDGVGDPPVSLLRRIVALPGEKVDWSTTRGGLLGADEYFVDADKKEGVVGGWQLGPVRRRAIIGKVSYTWFAKNPSKQEESKVESGEARIPQPVL